MNDMLEVGKSIIKRWTRSKKTKSRDTSNYNTRKKIIIKTNHLH